MATFHYPWQRFWVDRDSYLQVDDAGFLVDPTSPWFQPTTAQVSDLSELADVPCVVLLGEPGSGKTTSLREYREHLQNSDEVSQLVWADLRDYSSSGDIREDVFGRREFEDWMSGSHLLWLFLDGLDERIENLGAITGALLRQIRKLPVERLRLRITCRTAEWPTSLEQDLRSMWTHERTESAEEPEQSRLAVYEIAPLRRSDVGLAARTRQIDPEVFLEEVFKQGAQAFALKPVTLGFLLDVFEQDGALPSSIAELYSRGCRILCDETNPRRRDLQPEPALTTNQRLSIARRIAALTILGNKAAVWRAPDIGQIPDTDVTVDDIAGDLQSGSDPSSFLSPRMINEALETALFTTRGAERLGWAHQTFGEFLAAQFLAEPDLSLPQVTSLLFHPVDGQVIPQLRGVAAWAASMHEDLLSLVVESDPDIAIQGDLVPTSDRAKADVVDALLGKFARLELIDDWFSRHNYRKLCHPNLADQLHPVITDPDAQFVARRAAIDLAEECGLTSLQHDLLNLALNTLERSPDRINAAYAVSQIGDATTRSQLLPLISEPMDSDPDFELRGVALQALWPDFLSTDEMFPALEPIDSHLIGAYNHFLHYLPARLQAHDFVTALDWTSEQEGSHELPFNFEDLINDILLAAREHLAFEGVLAALGRAIWSRLKKHDHDFRSTRRRGEFRFLNNQTELSELIRIVISSIEDPTDSTYFLMTEPRLLDSSDTFWLIEDLDKTSDEHLQLAYVKLIGRLADMTSVPHIDAVLQACDDQPLLAAEFGNPQLAVELDSIEASLQRKRHEEIEGFRARLTSARRQTLDPPAAHRVEQLLRAIESEEPLKWWWMARHLELDEDDLNFRRPDETDIRDLPGWQSASQETHRQIIRTAMPYLLELPRIDDFDQIGPDNDYRCIGGYRAIRLLLNESPQMLYELPAEMWDAWGLTILGLRMQGELSASNDQVMLSCLAYRKAPRATLATLRRLILERNAKDDAYVERLEWVRACWDEQIEDTLLTLVQRSNLRTASLQVVLMELVKAEATGVQYLAERLIGERHGSEAQWNHAISTGALLLQHATDAGWPILWPALNEDTSFGRSIIESAVAWIGVSGGPDLHSRLSEQQLADLYEWLELQYPEDEDPGYDSGRTLTAITNRHEVANFRRSVVQQLRNKGTFEARQRLYRLSQRFPENLSLKLNAIDAGQIARQVTWIPPTSDDILALASDRNARLVQSGEHLLDVVEEVLGKLQIDLHGETPRVRGLWNEIERWIYRPKDEEDLSDFLKNYLDDHLADRAIVFGREVRIRRPSKAKGENTDIHIDAVSKLNRGHGYERITAIAEVKGGWHRDLFTAMKDQLVDRYLKDNRCQHGLYIVGWFNCEEWDSSDSRQQRRPGLSIDEVRTRLEAQAADLSIDGISIRAVVLNTAFR